jgi:hypothetical protein
LLWFVTVFWWYRPSSFERIHAQAGNYQLFDSFGDQIAAVDVRPTSDAQQF